MGPHYDVVVGGTSFASTFFLHRFLRRFPDRRVLVLERGGRKTQAWRLQKGRVSTISDAETLENRNPERKHWAVNVAFGGNSHAWWACTPRFMPRDFRTQSEYGVGRDWPLSYEDLESYYDEAEQLMGVSGSADAPWPRRAPPPLPPHLVSDAEVVWQRAHPGLAIPTPTARWSMPQQNPTRAQCCAMGACTICPIDAKFTIENSMAEVYSRPNVDLRLQSPLLHVDIRNDIATGVTFLDGDRPRSVTTDLVVLGTNAIMNPFLLQCSGFEHPMLGRGLGEQTSTYVSVKLGGLQSFNGSTSLTTQGYMLYDGEHRRDHAGILLEVSNIPRLRMEPGRWREVMHLKAIVEVLPDAGNYVGIDRPNGETSIGRPFTVYASKDEYAERAFARLPTLLERALEGLPVEEIEIQGRSNGEAHITGTTPMGDDPATSIVDRHLVTHKVRNLVLPGAGVFPTTPPANPTLTLSALSLWAAEHLA